jgi:ADP-ribose pyrophosphatase
MEVEITSKRRLLDDFFKVEEVWLKHKTYAGDMSSPMRVLSFERGNSVAAILWHKERQAFLLIEQFRYPTLAAGYGWVMECVAGGVKPEEDPLWAVKREIEEETGFSASNVRLLSEFFVSPGGSTERILLYFGEISDSQQIGLGGGLKEELEDIKMIFLSPQQVREALAQRKIVDAKTIIGLMLAQPLIS